uniref:(northern house mosquito) hypothetical protein n=1 Tax=Culex pipiens TaxID=7175 RepID=A0A8D8G4I8_CULPI
MSCLSSVTFGCSTDSTSLDKNSLTVSKSTLLCTKSSVWVQKFPITLLGIDMSSNCITNFCCNFVYNFITTGMFVGFSFENITIWPSLRSIFFKDMWYISSIGDIFLYSNKITIASNILL